MQRVPDDPEGTVTATLQFIVEQAQVLLAARRVWLFGSRSRQTSSRRSDIDVAVEADERLQNAWGSFAITVREEAPTLLPIDLVDISTCGADLRATILEEGILLYVRHQDLEDGA